MNVLSLFDGLSGGRVALEKAGIEVDNYYSSEIDKYAIQIANKNYPQDEVNRLGDITKWQDWNINWSNIDLVTGGFPCQAWSIAGKQQGDRDERGMLFWTMIDIMKKVLEHNPKAKFLIENVKMKKEFEEYITLHTSNALGVVYKHLINSALVSAQNRERYYWTNIPNITEPEDKGFLIRDILEDKINSSFYMNKPLILNGKETGQIGILDYKDNERQKRVYLDNYKSPSLLARSDSPRIIKIGDLDMKASQQIKRVYSTEGLSPTLDTMQGGHRQPKILIENKVRKLTPLECERLQTLPDKVFYAIIDLKELLCLDQAKNFVNVVEKNHKLLKLVLNAEKKELREYVNTATKSMSVSHQSKKHIAQKNVDTQTPKQTKECTIHKQTELNINANNVESSVLYQSQESEVGSVVVNVPMNLIEGRIAHNGKAESLLRDNNSLNQKNGKSVQKLSLKEIMELAENVGLGITKKTEKSSIYTTSYHLSTQNIEQILTILYCFAKSAIDGCIATRIQIESLYLSLTNGYTEGVSNSSRYKMLGNGWTIDVIAHILKGLK